MGHVCTDLRYLATLAVAVVLAGAVPLQAPLATVSAPLVQDQGEDDGGDDAGEPAQEYAAGIYAGSCDSPGADSAFPLTNVAPHGEGDAGVYASETEVAAPLADLLGDLHAITILASGADLAAIRACADVGGQVVDAKLIVPLRAPNDDDLLGVAVLEEREGATVVELYLVLSEGGIAVDDDGDDEDDASENGDGDGDGDGGV